MSKPRPTGNVSGRGPQTETTKPSAVSDHTRTRNAPPGALQVSPGLNIEPSLLETVAGGTSLSTLCEGVERPVSTEWMITALPARLDS